MSDRCLSSLSVCLSDGVCGQTVTWINLPLGTEVGLDPGHIVFDGNRAPPPKGAQQPLPHFSAHVYYGQTIGWIKMPLGTDVGLGPGHIVLDAD